MTLQRKADRFTARCSVLGLFVLGIALSARSESFDIVKFVNSGTDSDWANASNWSCTNSLKNQALPGNDVEARINNASVRLTTAVTVGNFKIADSSPAELIIDGGTLQTVDKHRGNGIGYFHPATLIITNGGSFICSSFFVAGRQEMQGVRVEIYDGTLQVAREYRQNHLYEGSEPLDTRTTIHPGGVLEAKKLELNAGVLNIAGGSVIIKEAAISEIEQWIQEGRITAMGGKADWKINASLDPSTGFLVMIAESLSSPAAADVHAGLNGKWVLIILGSAAAGLILLFALLRLNLKLKLKKLKSEQHPGKTYDF
ncbi:MAG: hypothetical protein FJ220_05355 [Kiritimatiellaceae bacterium]|nr:hypothetical protein [Kiritimatiellaceae bacterium]